jgi:hypothetical protein
MRQRLSIILTLVVIIGVLVVLNSITHVQKDDTQDYESFPNRSSYHAGPTGLRALFDYLSESGHKVIRWRETPHKLLGDSGKVVDTFVVVGQVKIPFTQEEQDSLSEWISQGGRFVLVDRDFDMDDPGHWKFKKKAFDFPNIDTNPGDSAQMTDTVTALKPVQPTVLTTEVESVLPSRFATRLLIETATSETKETDDDDAALKPILRSAPVVHIADENGALLIDYAYGQGRIVILTDPYLVSNNGIKLNDNLRLALNVLTARGGLVAFDEYHQGRGVTGNALATYFAGTPVMPLVAQIGLLILLILWSNARRFGRPLPLAGVDRRSTLEYVASMAELQERSRAFDLAIENIYTRTRRVLARLAGLDYNSPRSEIAERIALRSSVDRQKLETLMRQCEDAINGAPITWRQSIDLVRRLREIEKELGLRMRSRDARQAAEKI